MVSAYGMVGVVWNVRVVGLVEEGGVVRDVRVVLTGWNGLGGQGGLTGWSG